MHIEKFSEKKLFYYLKFRDGYTQVNVAKLLFKKAYGRKPTGEDEDKIILKKLQEEAGYYARILVKDGYLEEQKYRYNGKMRSGNPKVYVATSVTPSNMELPTSSNMESQRWVGKTPIEIKVPTNGNGHEYDWKKESGIDVLEKDIDVHHLSFKFQVNSKPRRKIHWDKINNDMKGIIQKFLYWEGDDAVTTIRYDQYKDANDMVVMWVPSTTIPAGQHDEYINLLENYMYKASAWFQRVMQCRLSLPEFYRRPHYAVAIREPEVRSAIEKGMTFKNGEVHMDNSKPKVGPCFESTKFKVTKCYSELPDRMLRVETFLEKAIKEFTDLDFKVRLEKQEEAMYKVWIAIDQLAEGNKRIIQSQQKVIENMNKLQEVLLESQQKLIENQRKYEEQVMKMLNGREEKDNIRKSESDEKMYG